MANFADHIELQHGGANEHKGPSDFNGRTDGDDDDDGDGTPPRGAEDIYSHMLPPQCHTPQSHFSELRSQRPSASPPIPNSAPFRGAFGSVERSHTPQPPMGSRMDSSSHGRKASADVISQHSGSQAPHPGVTYMPTPSVYHPAHPHPQPSLLPAPGSGYGYHHQPGQPSYTEERRPSPLPAYITQAAPAQAILSTSRANTPPPTSFQQLSQPPSIHVAAHITQSERRHQDPQPPPPMGPKMGWSSQPPLLDTDLTVKKLPPQRKSHSIFTPIEENRSILSQHLASFAAEPQSIKHDSSPAGAPNSESIDVPAETGTTAQVSSPLQPQQPGKREDLDDSKPVDSEEVSLPDASETPPSHSNSFKSIGGGRSRGPRLTVQIPDGASDPGNGAGESSSPRNRVDAASQSQQRHNSHSSIVLPPPSPSASALLSAGATGPPNPFARPPPQQSVNGETPLSCLPSRFMNNELLPSPSSFYQDWNIRSSDGNTLPSPLNFTTPVVGNGPSFLREDGHGQTSVTAVSTGASAEPASKITATAGPSKSSSDAITGDLSNKRKSPEFGDAKVDGSSEEILERKRVRVE